MAVAQLNTSTLSAALDASTNDFLVGSTTNILADYIMVVRGEAMKVMAVPAAGRVQVSRGVAGTEARSHPNAQRFFIGTADQFKFVRDSVPPGLTGSSGVFPDYLLPGQRAKDNAGNEYILLDLTMTAYSGTAVLISTDGLYTATVLVGGNQGSVAILAEEGTSNQYAWGQIYGNVSGQIDATSAADSTYVATAATSISTPSVGLSVVAVTSGAADSYLIQGAFVTGIATTATTSATSHTGTAVPLWLNYPFVRQVRAVISTS